MADLDAFTKELVFLVHQYLAEEGFMESVHRLERESGLYFNMAYFVYKVLGGEWEDVETYLSGFTKIDDNIHSANIYFEIRKQKYLEALDSQDKKTAIHILMNELKGFEVMNKDLYKQITHLITLSNFRENKYFSEYGDTLSSRTRTMLEVKKLLEANPVFHDKFTFPKISSGRLRIMINQGLNMQHHLCSHPSPNPDTRSLAIDQVCLPTNENLVHALPTAPNPAPARAHDRAPARTLVPACAPALYSAPAHAVTVPAVEPDKRDHLPSPSNMAIAGAAKNDASPSAAVGSSLLSSHLDSNQGRFLKKDHISYGFHNHGEVDHPAKKRVRMGKSHPKSNQEKDDISRNLPNHGEVNSSSPEVSGVNLDDYPRTVALSLNQASIVTSMDFHPYKHTILLAGEVNGTVTIWEFITQKKLLSDLIMTWDMSACSIEFQESLERDATMSVLHVLWSQDGNFLAVAFSKHLVHVYAFISPIDIRRHVEIDAHVGKVNNLAFALSNHQLCIVTCGDDKLIKVWDMYGIKLFQFEGHEAPVHSLCYHRKQKFIFSTSDDGKIKAWRFGNKGPKISYDIVDLWYSTMIYSNDGQRLFSCGTSKEGNSFLVEWNEAKEPIKTVYKGLRKKLNGVVQFDIAKTRILAAGDENQIKFWRWDNFNLLSSTNAGGGLPILPRLKFNKEGYFLAVNTTDNRIKILASEAGFRILGKLFPLKNEVNVPNFEDGTRKNPRLILAQQITEPDQCLIVTMSHESGSNFAKVGKLVFFNDGCGILSLTTLGNHKFWKWRTTEMISNVIPRIWQMKTSVSLRNNMFTGVNFEAEVTCLAIAKNGTYLLSVCGGKVTLFNMVKFKVEETLMKPPIASTFVAFHPLDTKIMLFGMEDSFIHICHTKMNAVQLKLKGHEKQVTGISFSCILNLMVSAGADAQLCFWSLDKWEKKNSLFLQLPGVKEALRSGDTSVQFHADQISILVSHGTQLAIYDGSTTNRLLQWVPQGELPSAISGATYSCDCLMIYTTFLDGSIGIFESKSLRIMCRIAPNIYTTPRVLMGYESEVGYSVVLVAHPEKSNKFAVGLSNGSVKIIEPSSEGGKWGA